MLTICLDIQVTDPNHAIEVLDVIGAALQSLQVPKATAEVYAGEHSRELPAPTQKPKMGFV